MAVFSSVKFNHIKLFVSVLIFLIESARCISTKSKNRGNISKPDVIHLTEEINDDFRTICYVKLI
jgi:hypothetical protein